MAKRVYLMLVHSTGIANPLVWQRFLIASKGAAALAIHVDANGPQPDLGPLQDYRLEVSLPTRWGSAAMVSAELRGAAEAFSKHPTAQHVVVCSGTDVPIKRVPPSELADGTSYFRFYYDPQANEANVSKVRSSPNLADEHRPLLQHINFHSQWCILCREHALLLAHREAELLAAFAPVQWAFGGSGSSRVGLAPDEWFLYAGLRMWGVPAARARDKVACAAYFDACRMHPVTFRSLQLSEQHLGGTVTLGDVCRDAAAASGKVTRQHVALTLRKVDLADPAEQLELLGLLEQCWRRL